MPEQSILPGDPLIPRLFGFPGFEAMLKIVVEELNILRNEQGMPIITYEQMRLKIEEKTDEILGNA